MSGHIRFRDAILQGTHSAVLTQVGEQPRQDSIVGRLLGEQEHHVVNPVHLGGGDSLYGHSKVHGSHDVGTFCIQCLHVSLIAVNQLHITSVFGHVGAQYCAHGTAAQDCNSHLRNLLNWNI